MEATQVRFICKLAHDIAAYILWTALYRIIPVSAENCRTVKESSCGTSPQNGVYWVQDQQVAMCIGITLIYNAHYVFCYFMLTDLL